MKVMRNMQSWISETFFQDQHPAIIFILVGFPRKTMSKNDVYVTEPFSDRLLARKSTKQENRIMSNLLQVIMKRREH